MISVISPYALLKSSKPKPAPVYLTDYDLFSAVAQTPYDAQAQTSEPVQANNRLPPEMPMMRTHYISDIRSRHSHAAKKAQPSASPLISQTSSSVQRPFT